MPAEEGDALHAAALAAAAAVPSAPFVEVGSYCGRSTIWLARPPGRRAPSCSPSTTTAARRRTRPAGSTTTRRSSTPAPGEMDTLPTFRDTIRDAGLEDRVVAVVGQLAGRRPVLGDAGGAGVHRRRPRRRAGPRRLRRLGAPRGDRRHAGHPRRLPGPRRRRPPAVRGDLPSRPSRAAASASPPPPARCASSPASTERRAATRRFAGTRRSMGDAVDRCDSEPERSVRSVQRVGAGGEEGRGGGGAGDGVGGEDHGGRGVRRVLLEREADRLAGRRP